MRYRLLRPDERPLLEDLHRQHPQLPLGPEYGTAAIAVAEDSSGSICGVLCLQLAWHMEPLVLTGKGRPDPLQLAAVLESWLAGAVGPSASYYCFDDGKAAKLCEANNMTKCFDAVYSKKAGG